MMKKDIAIIVLAGALCLCCSFMITNFIIQRGHEKYPDATANPSSVSDKQFGEIGESVLAGEDDKGGAEPDSLLATDMTDEVETAVIDENAIIFEWNPKDFKIQGQNFDFECIEKLCDIHDMQRGCSYLEKSIDDKYKIVVTNTDNAYGAEGTNMSNVGFYSDERFFFGVDRMPPDSAAAKAKMIATCTSTNSEDVEWINNNCEGFPIWYGTKDEIEAAFHLSEIISSVGENIAGIATFSSNFSDSKVSVTKWDGGEIYNLFIGNYQINISTSTENAEYYSVIYILEE